MATIKFGLTVLVFLLAASFASAVPTSFSYQGRILKQNGTGLEYNDVNFRFEIVSPNGSCVIYQEQLAGMSMVNSGGVFDVSIGNNSVQYIPAGRTSILDLFSNSTSYACGSCVPMGAGFTCSPTGSTYTPSVGDIRKLRVSFHDGIGWKVITPDNEIRSVPFAASSLVAERVGSTGEADILTRALAPTCVAANSFLQWNGTDFDCVAASIGGGGSVTEVTSANAYITVATGTSTPALTLNVGTSAGTVAAGNDSRFTDARTPTGTAGGDLTGTYPNPELSATGVVAGTFPKVTVDAKGRVTSGAALLAADIPNLDASKITTGNITNNVVNSSTSSGTGSFQNLRLYDGESEYLVQVYPSGGAGYTISWPESQGGANSVLQNDGAGNLSWVAIPSAPVTTVAGRTGAVVLSNTDISGLGTSAVLNVAASGNAAAGEVVKGDDTRLTDGRAPTGSAGGDLSGTYPNPTVARIQGQPVDTVAPSADGQALLWDGAKWHANFVRAQDLRNAWGGTQMIPASACLASESMTWSAVTDRFACQAIGSLNASAITAGTISPTRLGSGTADNSTYLRGDGTWSALTPNPNTILNGGNSFGAPATIGTDDAFALNLEVQGTPRMTFLPNGAVGIGVANPLFGLHVQKDGLYFTDSSGTQPYIYGTSGNLGFGFSGTPLARVHISQTGASTVDKTAVLINSASTSNTANTVRTGLRVHNASAWNGTNSTNIGLDIDITASSTFNYSALFNGGGVGIGNRNPTSELDLSGSFTLRALPSPGLSPALQGRIFFDSVSNKFKVSENGSAYVDLLPAGGAIGGTGSVNAIPKFTAAGVIGSSAIIDNGTTITATRSIASTTNAVATGSTLDLGTSNTHTLASVGGSTITISNQSNGGVYNIIVADGTQRTYTFAGCTNTFFKPANAPTAAGTRTVYGLMTVQSGGNWDCYVTWSTGFQ